MTSMNAGVPRRLLGWSLPVLFVAALLMVAGCGNSDQKTGAQVQPGEAEKKATNAMEDFMKNKGKSAKPASK